MVTVFSSPNLTPKKLNTLQADFTDVIEREVTTSPTNQANELIQMAAAEKVID